MCETLGDHWGYAKNDLNFKSTADIIRSFAICRRYRSNFLLNVGPKADGSLRLIDKAYLEVVGQWYKLNSEAIHTPAPVDIAVKDKPNNFFLKDGNNYYLFFSDLGASGDANVVFNHDTNPENVFTLDEKVKSVRWLDSDEELTFTQEGNTVNVQGKPYKYGQSYVVRVAKITV
jgi:alpha-L-fucosidase